MVPGEEKTYLSFDTVCKMSIDIVAEDVLYPVEFLNSLKFNGILHHELKLKKDAPIMLLQNINQSARLCNGIRLITTHLTEKAIEAGVMTGSQFGTKVYIPRIII